MTQSWLRVSQESTHINGITGRINWSALVAAHPTTGTHNTGVSAAAVWLWMMLSTVLWSVLQAVQSVVLSTVLSTVLSSVLRAVLTTVPCSAPLSYVLCAVLCCVAALGYVLCSVPCAVPYAVCRELSVLLRRFLRAVCCLLCARVLCCTV